METVSVCTVGFYEALSVAQLVIMYNVLYVHAQLCLHH